MSRMRMEFKNEVESCSLRDFAVIIGPAKYGQLFANRFLSKSPVLTKCANLFHHAYTTF